jgi:hypothetical protein
LVKQNVTVAEGMIMVHGKKHHEREHAHREEQDFKTIARRNKLLGLWVAEQLGLHGDAAEAYAREVVLADLEEAGEDDLFRKIHTDLKNHNKDVPDAELRRKLAECYDEAKRQVQTS